MNKNLKYWLLAGFIVGVVVVFIIITINYNSNKYNNDDIDVDFNDTSKMVLSNIVTLTDAVGKKMTSLDYKKGAQGFAEFTVKSNTDSNIKYEIYLVKEEHDETIPEKFVKVYLTDENDNVLSNDKKNLFPTYYELRVSETNPGGKLVYTGVLKGNDVQKFKLRAWVADTYEITPNPREFSFDVKVNVK